MTQLRPRTIAAIAAALTLLLHLIANPHYGFFRDELYFIICGMHPQFGYVDQPPLIPFMAAATQIFGHSLFLLRALPALFAAAGVYVTLRLVIEFEGNAYAQILAAVVFFFCDVLANFGMKVSTDMVGLLTWPLLALLLVRIVKGGDAKTLWLWAGLVMGISLESKYSVIFFITALAIGLLLTPQRRILANRWCAAGCALALLIALPNFLWQAHYGFPMIELLRAGQNGKNEIAGPLLFLLQEVLITGLLLALVWIAGLVWLFRNAPMRFLAWTYVAIIAMMIVLHGKHYYPANIYPVLIAAGGVAIEAWTKRIQPARYVIAALAFIVGLVLIPHALPILPESRFVAYSRALSSALHISASKATETEPGRDSGTLPGDWADMHGWENMATSVKRVYDSLPPDQRAQAVVKTPNYGEASAIAFFTPDVPVISGHNQYWLWGTRGYSGNVLIDVNGDCGKSIHAFKSSTLAATVHDRWAIGYENNIPIRVCRGIHFPLSRVWPMVKDYE